jgi:hypothetical protein
MAPEVLGRVLLPLRVAVDAEATGAFEDSEQPAYLTFRALPGS